MSAGSTAGGALAAVMTVTDAPLLMVSALGVVLAASPAFEEQFGFVPWDLEALEALCATESGRDLDLASLVRRGTPASGIARLRSASGEFVRAGYAVTPLGARSADDGAVLALQPLAPRMLSEGTAFAALARSAADIVWIAAVDGTVLLSNGELPDGLGAPPGPSASEPPLTNLHPDDYEPCRALWAAARREHVQYEASARHRRADGRYAAFTTRAVPLTTTDGEVVGWFGTTTALERAGAAAGVMPDDSRQVDARLATASHEIRSPLSVLRGTAQLARRQAASRALTGDEVSEALTSIEEQADRALRLVEQLLDESRLELGRLGLQRSSCDVAALAKQVLERVAAASDSHRFTLRAGGPAVSEIDVQRIEQVLLNLVDNAMKFSPPGSVIETSVTNIEHGAIPTVEVVVRDHGRGVPAGEEGRIFERFHQVTGEDATRGLGVGLAVSREIVELHGGTLSVGTPQGEGARFLMRLPARRT